MRILTKKKQDEILKLLAANEIIAIKGLKEEYLDSFCDNSINAICAIGGIKGLQKVTNTLKNYLRQVSRMNECLDCGCYDEDIGCTMPSIDKWYACPLYTCEDELKEMFEGVERLEAGMKHQVVRVDNLMYKGCEPHWGCKKCGCIVPFHCYKKEEFEQMECKEDDIEKWKTHKTW